MRKKVNDFFLEIILKFGPADRNRTCILRLGGIRSIH